MAASVLELFPHAYLKGGQPTTWGFYYDVLLEDDMLPESLILIEEKMRQMSKKGEEFYIMEMMPQNAQDYFKSIERDDLQDRNLRSDEPLTRAVKIGEFLDLCHFTLPKKTSEISHFKLLESLPIEGGLRIVGTAFFDKTDLKEFVKKWENISNYHYVRWIQELDLLEKIDDRWIWCPRGEMLKETLINFWKRELLKQNFQFISTSSFDLDEMCKAHLKVGEERFIKTAEIAFMPLKGEGIEGLLDLPCGVIDQAYIPFKKEELTSELISSLQFILKILKMFSFDYEVVLRSKNAKPIYKALEESQIKVRHETGPGCAIDFYLIDIFGREWKGPCVTVHMDKRVIVQSIFSSLERFVALLLETCKGNLPLWSVPEHVRVMGFHKKEIEDVVSLLQKEGFRVGIDLGSDALSKKMHDSLLKRVPYSIVLGDRELESKTLSVRAYGAKASEPLKIETLIDRLRKELESQ